MSGLGIRGILNGMDLYKGQDLVLESEYWRSPERQQTQACEEHTSLDSPVYHILPYVSGGLERLLHRIKTDAVPELAEYGYHTNDEGHFEPVGQCIMGLRYRVKQKLDTKGHSAVLVLAEDLFDHKKLVVIKVLHTHLYQLGSQESHVLWRLAVADPLNHSQTLRLLTTLTFDSHYCMVFEPLLPEPLTRIFQEFPANRVLPNLRKVGLRLLATLGFLHQQDMIHTDLKPENILLKYESDLDSVHVVDFGNAIHYVHKEVSLYYKDFELQTPLYRAPEVMFGMPFGTEIDMWSLGCILAELYTGEALFYGTDKKEIMTEMQTLLGPFPASIFKRGKFFQELKSFTNADEGQTRDITVLMNHLKCRDVAFVELLSGLLKYNPDERLTVREAACHPFFASLFPVGFLLGSHSGSSSHSANYISSNSYHFSPKISPDIKKRQPSSKDLLKIGTSESCLTDTHIIKPKPMEILNKRRKSAANRVMKDKIKSPNELPDANGPLSPRMTKTNGPLSPRMIKTNGPLSPRMTKTNGPLSLRMTRTNGPLSPRMTKTSFGQTTKTSFGHSERNRVTALIHKQNEEKLSGNVKEKMSSLLEAIRQEQDLVEKDMERKSRETSLKESSFSSSYSSDGHNKSKRDSRTSTAFGLDSSIQNRSGSHEFVDQNVVAVPDVVKDVESRSGTKDNILFNNRRNQAKRYQPEKTVSEESGSHYQFEDRERIHGDASKESGSHYLFEDRERIHGDDSTRTFDRTSPNSLICNKQYSPDVQKSLHLNSGRDTKHDQIQNQTLRIESMSGLPIQTADSSSERKVLSLREEEDKSTDDKFEHLFTDIKTPKQAKLHTTEGLSDDEYIEMLSPYDPLSANKRHYIMRNTTQLTGSSEKKASVRRYTGGSSKPEDSNTRKSSSDDQKVNSYTDNQVNSLFPGKCEERTQNRKTTNPTEGQGPDSNLESQHKVSQECDSKESNNSARRKCYEKATLKINNMKKDQINFRHYNLYDKRRKPRISNEQLASVRIPMEEEFSNSRNDNKKGTIISNDYKQPHEEIAYTGFDKHFMLQDRNENCTKNTNFKQKSSNKANKYRSSQGDRNEVVFPGNTFRINSSGNILTPIHKVKDHIDKDMSQNTAESPEILYKKASPLVEKITAFTEKLSDSQRLQVSTKERKRKVLIVNQRKSGAILSSKHLDKTEQRLLEQGHRFRNLSELTDTDKLPRQEQINCAHSSTTDPFDFQGTPATDIKRLSVGGIGERIQLKRDMVKKKARKSLEFGKKTDLSGIDYSEEGVSDEDSDKNVSDEDKSRFHKYNTYSGKDKVLSLENTNKDCHISEKQARQNKGIDIKHSQGRKRLLSIPSADPRKKIKVEKMSNINETSKKFAKKSKFIKTFDTTYTIEFESPNH